jgi:ribosome maturation protein SDO1
LIAKNAFNPQTNAPHPPQRIETAMEEAKIHVDLFRPATEQMNDIIKEIRKLIPISIEKMKFAVRIPAQYSGKGSSVLHRYEVKQEEWQRDGSVVAVLELPAGVKQDLMNDLNALTKGNVEVKLLSK